VGNGQLRTKLKVPARHLSGMSEKCPGETSVRMIVGSGINTKISLMLLTVIYGRSVVQY